MFCNNCGGEISSVDKFCPYCGQQIANDYTKAKMKTREERLQRIKCPNCGDLINAFSVKCPSCSFELREIEANGRVEDLANKINVLSAKGTKASGSQIAELIKTYPIPNTVDDILELMILASANLDPYSLSENGEAEEIDRKIAKAWEAKMQQAYNKASVTFSDSKRFIEVERIHMETLAKIKKADSELQKEKRRINLSDKLPLVLCFGTMIVMIIAFSWRDAAVLKNGGAKTSYSASDLKGMNYEEVIDIMESDGFTNIKVKGDDGGLFNSQKEGEVIKITIDGSNFGSGSVESSEAAVLIIYKE